MQDKRLKKLDTNKLSFLQKIIFDLNKLEPDEKLPFLMALASSKAFQNISFTKEESELLKEVMKDYSSEDEYQKANNFLKLFQS